AGRRDRSEHPLTGARSSITSDLGAFGPPPRRCARPSRREARGSAPVGGTGRPGAFFISPLTSPAHPTRTRMAIRDRRAWTAKRAQTGRLDEAGLRLIEHTPMKPLAVERATGVP